MEALVHLHLLPRPEEQVAVEAAQLGVPLVEQEVGFQGPRTPENPPADPAWETLHLLPPPTRPCPSILRHSGES